MSSQGNNNNGINSGFNGGRIVSSFNLGGQGACAGGGAYHIYGNNLGESSIVSQTDFNNYNSNYTHSNSNLYNSYSKKK
jgi:hypothetical protein